jgi:hypothetical protein
VRDQERDQILRGSGTVMRMSGFFLIAAHAIRTVPAQRDRRKNRLSGTAKNSRQRAKASLRFALRRSASKSTRAVREMRRRSVSSLSWPQRGKLSSAQNCSLMGHIAVIRSVSQRTTRAQISQAREGLLASVLSLRKTRVASLLFVAPRLREPMDEGKLPRFGRHLANRATLSYGTGNAFGKST